MLDLGFLLPSSARHHHARADSAESLQVAYDRYVTEQHATNPDGIPMSAEDFQRFSLESDWLSGMKDAAKKVVQTCRLMVGIHDYEHYLAHMRERHPEATPLTREAFYRYCLEARYPSDARSGGSRCPC